MVAVVSRVPGYLGGVLWYLGKWGGWGGSGGVKGPKNNKNKDVDLRITMPQVAGKKVFFIQSSFGWSYDGPVP